MQCSGVDDEETRCVNAVLAGNVTVKVTATAGRGLFAAQELAETGVDVFTEQAFVSATGPFGCHECVCHTCLTREDDDGEELLRCDTCRWAHWCSPACRSADTLHDSVECSAMASLRFGTLDAPASVPLAARLLRSTRPDRHHGYDFRAAQASLARTLVGLSPALDVKPLQEQVALVLELAGLTSDHAPEALHALAQLQRNQFRVMDERGVVVGAALFPAAARMNHSCTPNLAVSTRESGGGWVLRVEALRDIRRGEELLFNYVAKDADGKERYLHRCRTLQRQYLFTCACGADTCCCK